MITQSTENRSSSPKETENKEVSETRCYRSGSKIQERQSKPNMATRDDRIPTH